MPRSAKEELMKAAVKAYSDGTKLDAHYASGGHDYLGKVTWLCSAKRFLREIAKTLPGPSRVFTTAGGDAVSGEAWLQGEYIEVILNADGRAIYRLRDKHYMSPNHWTDFQGLADLADSGSLAYPASWEIGGFP